MTREGFFLVWLEAAIRQDWGERCAYEIRDCGICRAWSAYDFIQSFIHNRERDENGMIGI